MNCERDLSFGAAAAVLPVGKLACGGGWTRVPSFSDWVCRWAADTKRIEYEIKSASRVHSAPTGRWNFACTRSQGFTLGYFHPLPPGGGASVDRRCRWETDTKRTECKINGPAGLLCHQAPDPCHDASNRSQFGLVFWGWPAEQVFICQKRRRIRGKFHARLFQAINNFAHDGVVAFASGGSLEFDCSLFLEVADRTATWLLLAGLPREPCPRPQRAVLLPGGGDEQFQGTGRPASRPGMCNPRLTLGVVR